MDIWQLKSVLAIAKYNSFTKAADSLCLSQSAISVQIQKLEKELGVPLFERTTRMLKLTPAGEEFVNYAAEIIALANKAQRSMQEYTALKRGHMTIGTLPIMGFLGIASLVATFKKQYPDVTVAIHEASSDKLLQELVDAEIDVAVATISPEQMTKYPDLHDQSLFSDEVVFITDKGHPFAQKGLIDLSAAANESHIFMKANYGLRQVCINACQHAGFYPNIAYECEQVESIIGLVAEGLGIAMLNIRTAQSFSHANIAIVHFTPKIERPTSILWRKRARLPHVLSAFIDCSQHWKRNQ